MNEEERERAEKGSLSADHKIRICMWLAINIHKDMTTATDIDIVITI